MQHAQDLVKVQNEINAVNALMLIGVLIGVAMIFTCFVAGAVTEKNIFHEAALILGITVVFWVARNEVMIHRPVPWIDMVQAAQGDDAKLAIIPPWEKYLAKRKSRNFTFLLDMAAGIAFFWIFIRAGRALLADGQGFWVLVYASGIAAGIGTAALMVWIVRKGW